MRRAIWGRPWAWLAAASAIAVVASPLVPAVAQAASAAPAAGSGRLALVSVSNPRPELVSGGEVLIQVQRAAGQPGLRTCG